MLIRIGKRVERFGGDTIPRCRILPLQHTRPFVISRRESALAK